MHWILLLPSAAATTQVWITFDEDPLQDEVAGLSVSLEEGASLVDSPSLSADRGLDFDSGRCLAIAGGAHAAVADDPAMEPDTFTLSVWARPDIIAGTNSLLAHGNTDDLPTGYWLTLIGGRPRLTIGGSIDTFAEQEIASDTALEAGVWSHVVATFDGAAAALYIDGVQVAAEPVEVGLTYGDEPLTIGHIPGRSFDFIGNIDEVRILSGALTEAEVAEWTADYDTPTDAGGTDSGGTDSGGTDSGGTDGGGDDSGGDDSGGDDGTGDDGAGDDGAGDDGAGDDGAGDGGTGDGGTDEGADDTGAASAGDKGCATAPFGASMMLGLLAAATVRRRR